MELTFGNALTTWIIRNGETIYTFAERCDVSPSAVRKWMDDRNMCQKYIKKVNELTGLDKNDSSTWDTIAIATIKEPVILNSVELEGVYLTEGDCPSCCMSRESCHTLKDLLGVKCGNQNGLIFLPVVKEQWVQCTHENTKAGSIVRCKYDEEPLLTVNHVINENLFVLQGDIGNYDIFHIFEFEVKVDTSQS